MWACSTIVSIMICLGSCTFPNSSAISSGKFLRSLNICAGILTPLWAALATKFNLSIGVEPSVLPFSNILFTFCVAALVISSLLILAPRADVSLINFSKYLTALS